jgi:2-polyprenyl-3-methyl-5-hydroxy-6-metoxy-1,4-benzoquinol methylase
MATVWENFWKHQNSATHEIMKVNTSFFAKQYEKLFQPKPGVRILDYGCGPGFLIGYLKKNSARFVGADINLAFIEECQKNFPNQQFILISTDTNRTNEIFTNALRAEDKFDHIVLLSISQYFTGLDELKSVIELLSKHLAPDGRIVIADVISPRTTQASDAISLLFQSLKQNRLREFVRFMIHIFTSDYRKISGSNRLLRISNEEMSSVAEALAMKCTPVEGLTIHRSRKNFILWRPASKAPK